MKFIGVERRKKLFEDEEQGQTLGRWLTFKLILEGEGRYRPFILSIFLFYTG